MERTHLIPPRMTHGDLVTEPALLSVLAAAAEARQQSLAILDLLDAYHADAAPRDPVPAETQLEQQLALSKQQKVLNARLARLRGLNRQAVLSVRATKQDTAEARQEIDSLHLQLQNLYYEQRHLMGEIAGCESYEHRYRTLPMIPIEDFLAEHPEHAESSEHDLTIARIKHEHQAREVLEEQRQQLVKRKEALAKEANAKKDELARLDAETEKWLNGQHGVRRLFESHEQKVARG